MNYETCALLSINKLIIYDKDKRDQVKVIIFYKSVMNSNAFWFNPANPKIGHSQVIQDQVVSTYVKVVSQLLAQ